jgi:cyclopropane fatty-acyl-phospholipid synthase-like methyltransferase
MSTCVGAACDFERNYDVAQAPVMREIERCVRGTDYGATSWTTRAQAEQTVARLGLTGGRVLLELGAGSGWPSLFLATQSGCDVVLTDLPLSGLRIARRRAVQDGLDGRCSILAADGAALPFADRSFDRIHHADVLCCMQRKREMLVECRRVARTGACMEFSVIALVRQPADDAERQLLQRSGPPYPDAGEDYAVQLADVGWSVIERIDVTLEFLRCMAVALDALHARRDALLQLLGERDYEEQLERRRSTRVAVERGLLRRDIFLARAARAGHVSAGTASGRLQR